jgi:hypothetical protein
MVVSTVPLIEERRGTMIKTMGMMKMYINSRRRVKALKSFLIIAASTDEKPNLPSKPALGM